MGAGISFTITSKALYRECPALSEPDNKSRASGNCCVKRFVLFIIKNLTITKGIKAAKIPSKIQKGVVKAAIRKKGSARIIWGIV